MPLIDLSDAVNVVEGYRDRNPDSWSLCNSIKFDIAELPTLSTDEVRGVVHCCNCYHAEPRNPVGEKTEIFCRLFIAGMREDDFCSRGEFLTNCGAKMEVREDA